MEVIVSLFEPVVVHCEGKFDGAKASMATREAERVRREEYTTYGKTNHNTPFITI